ncbi:MAG: acetate uptake transporter [Euryarchaeota archaeon]|nr:acetate uptake transporter [Euryarchaeota archaeon]
MVEKKTKNDEAVVITPISVVVADPAPLGLIGLAVAALVLASADLGLVSASTKSIMIPWVLFFGATAQLIAGSMEFKRNNIFGATVFTTYAMTMYSIALTLFIILFTGVKIDAYYAYGLIGVLVFSLIATVATLMLNKTFFAILVVVDLAVASLIPHYLVGFSPVFAGFFLLCTSAFSFYAAAAILLNTISGRVILPLGKALWSPAKKE